MSDLQTTDGDNSRAGSHKPGEYVVIARRYRPQSFDELIGQEHVSRALAAAIQTSRVGHAYLFTGARRTGNAASAGIQTNQIIARLRKIVESEGVEAEPEAVEILARRAAGSMRDSQSLLEQLLAFGSRKITVADVHGLLGTAGAERVSRLVGHVIE